MNNEKVQKAIDRLKAFEPADEPYYLCFSGGKDSDCIRILADLAGVKHDIVHSLTTVDAPETVKYIKSIPNVHIEMPKYSMWQLIEKKKMPPTRLMRYCCDELKEKGGKGRVKITGVRWAESNNRKNNQSLVTIVGKPKATIALAEELQADYEQTPKGGLILNTDNDESRRMVEQCYRTTSTLVNPIIDWTDEDVWQFLNHYGCKSNPLYQCGMKRIGCIGCPLQSGRGMKADFVSYPKYRDNYLRAFGRMLKARKTAGLDNNSWNSPEAVMMWWVGDNPLQMSFEIPEYLKGWQGR